MIDLNLKRNFERLATRCFGIFRNHEPYKSGNMYKNATTLIFDNNYSAQIRINPDIAPYSVYTVINWGLTSPVIVRAKNPAWIGRRSFLWNEDGPKKNPNEGWIERTVGIIIDDIAKTGGTILSGGTVRYKYDDKPK